MFERGSLCQWSHDRGKAAVCLTSPEKRVVDPLEVRMLLLLLLGQSEMSATTTASVSAFWDAIIRKQLGGWCQAPRNLFWAQALAGVLIGAVPLDAFNVE